MPTQNGSITPRRRIPPVVRRRRPSASPLCLVIITYSLHLPLIHRRLNFSDRRFPTAGHSAAERYVGADN